MADVVMVEAVRSAVGKRNGLSSYPAPDLFSDVLGATWGVLITKCLAELERTRGRYGLVTMCLGGGWVPARCSSGPESGPESRPDGPRSDTAAA